MKNLKIIVLAVVFIGLIGGYYFYLSNRQSASAEDNVEVTELDEVVSKDLENAYPPTPREVMKFYNRIVECAYAGDYDDSDFSKLASQARALMDEELLEQNPEQEYAQQFRREIASFKEGSQQIMQTSVCDTDEVVYQEIEGRKCAYVETIYFMKEGKSDFTRSYQRFLLRKDDKGNWKILAFYLINRKKASDEAS